MGGPYAGWTIKSQCATYRVLSGTGNLLIRGHVLAIAIPRIVQQDSSGKSVNQSVFIKYSKNIMANTTVCIACCYNPETQELQVWHSHSVPKSEESLFVLENNVAAHFGSNVTLPLSDPITMLCGRP